MPFTALLPAGGLIGGDAAVTAGFVRQSPHTHPDPHPAAQHPASRGALPGTRVGYRAEEGAEAWHNSVHVAGLVPLSTHCHQPAVYFRPSGSCSSLGGRGGGVAFAPESPAAPWGMASTGKAWEEESPTACLAPKPRARHTSLAKGKGLGWVAATVPLPRQPSPWVGISLPLSGKGLEDVKWRGQTVSGQGLWEITGTPS